MANFISLNKVLVNVDEISCVVERDSFRGEIIMKNGDRIKIKEEPDEVARMLFKKEYITVKDREF